MHKDTDCKDCFFDITFPLYLITLLLFLMKRVAKPDPVIVEGSTDRSSTDTEVYSSEHLPASKPKSNYDQKGVDFRVEDKYDADSEEMEEMESRVCSSVTKLLPQDTPAIPASESTTEINTPVFPHNAPGDLDNCEIRFSIIVEK